MQPARHAAAQPSTLTPLPPALVAPSRSLPTAQWHVGYVTQSYAPWARGFDTSYGFFANGVDHFSKCSYRAASPFNRSDGAWCRTLGKSDPRRLYDWLEPEPHARLEPSAFSTHSAHH